MAGSVFDSGMYAKLFPTGDVGKLFTDTAEVRAMMLVEGALAKVQGQAGVIPEISAQAIHRASMELQIDPSGLAKATGTNGVCVPALVGAFRELMQAPEHAQYLHWGATSQDIMDTGLMLRIKKVLAQYDARIRAILSGLSVLAEAHVAQPMAARTYGQFATPTSFGAVVAAWGWPLLSALDDLQRLSDALSVSLSGAAGTASELGSDAPALRAALAEALGLADPKRSWHADRSIMLQLGGWIARVSDGLGKMGEDLIAATQSGVGEVRLSGAGGSSTMPQKQNPVGPSALVALNRHIQGLNGTLHAAGTPRQQRDGSAWFTEWMVVPQLCLALSAALDHAERLTQSVTPDGDAMMATLDSAQGLLAAEALSFALTDRMSRPDAQAQVKDLCKEVIANGTHLRDAALAKWPDLNAGLFDPTQQMGEAPSEARAFIAAVKAI